MSSLVTCIRVVTFFGRNFEHGEEVDVEAFAEALDRDYDWLLAKMLKPITQVGMNLVPCFTAATGGGAEEDELPVVSTGPSLPKEPELLEVVEEETTEAIEYPDHEGYGRWKLSDGSKFRGKKDAALEAQAALDADVTPEETT